MNASIQLPIALSRHGRTTCLSGIEKVVGLTGFVIIHVFIALFSPAQGERNQLVNTKFTRPVNEMPMSISDMHRSPPALIVV